MIQVKDYRALLGVSPTASPDEIRHAYLALAKDCHPDLHPDDPAAAERFKEIQHAFERLYKPSRWWPRNGGVAMTPECLGST